MKIVGIGIGPFNLSAAALMAHVPSIESRFFESSPRFQWHPGLMFPEVTLQVSFLKDLVTLADPTSPYSFLSFLFATKRLYTFIIADLPRVYRREFEAYCRWVVDALPNLEFGRTVRRVFCHDGSLCIDLGDEVVSADGLVLGTGLSPIAPACARPHLGARVFHGIEYLLRPRDMRGQRVAVIGGGQSGAEVVYHLLCDRAHQPKALSWISRRPNFLPLDESPFTNELFTPSYSEHFFTLSATRRAQLLKDQDLASNGVSGDLLTAIYRRLYELEFIADVKMDCHLCPGRELTGLRPHLDGFRLALVSEASPEPETLDVDMVVLCTGFSPCWPEYLEPLAAKIPLEDGHFKVREDYSIEWEEADRFPIYVQNRAMHCRGIADPNLSLMAWRSATIVNSIAGRTVYDIAPGKSFLEWPVASVLAQVTQAS